jgi:hypothetical protein
MKIAKTIFAALFLVSNIAASSMAPADDGVIEKAVAPGSYCHQKVRAIDPSTLDSDNPSLRSSTSGDVIDYYGPCDETPKSEYRNPKQIQANNSGPTASLTDSRPISLIALMAETGAN